MEHQFSEEEFYSDEQENSEEEHKNWSEEIKWRAVVDFSEEVSKNKCQHFKPKRCMEVIS